MMSGVPGSKLSSSLEDIQEKFEESVRVNVRAAPSCPLHSLRPSSLLPIEPDVECRSWGGG